VSAAGASGAPEVDVVLDGFPLALARRSDEHHADLMRELALLALDAGSGDSDVPERLLALVDELEARYAATGAEADRLRESARSRGEETTRLVLPVPRDVGPAAARLLALLEEAEDFCREGRHLLTLAAEPEVRAFRGWYLGELTAQTSGMPPTPWPSVLERPVRGDD